MHESSSHDITGGVKTHQEEMKPQQDDSWSAQQDQDNRAASSSPVPSTSNAAKKKSRAGYWKEKKAARKKAQAAVDGDMNENGGVATLIPMENNETHNYGENDNLAKEDADNYTLLPSVEAPAPLFSPESKAKSKSGKKAKGASQVAPEQDQWQLPVSLNEGFAAEGGWDASVTQKVWDIENGNKNGNEPALAEGAKPKKTKPKKKKAKSKATGEPETEKDGFEPLGYSAGNVYVAMDANADANGEKSGDAAKGAATQQPKEAKKKNPKKKKAKKDKATIEGEPGTSVAPGVAEDNGAVDKETQHTPSSSVASAEANGDVNGPATSVPDGNNGRTLHDKKTNGVEHKMPDVHETKVDAEIPMPEPSNPKEQKPKQMKVRVDLDLELASVLKAKVKGEMMITFIN
ncbi:hypothetical protein FQN49_004781 [Arthroderma sp. PD_2]|nr:hypothetical protein FQN49_004781 [Arthroderma sp. PD_2]